MEQIEPILRNIALAVFSSAVDESNISTGLLPKRAIESSQETLYTALSHATQKLREEFSEYPEEAEDFISSHFLEKEGAQILAQFLTENRSPIRRWTHYPGELAMQWAESLNRRQQSSRKTYYISDLEPMTTVFFDILVRSLRSEAKDLQDRLQLEEIEREWNVFQHSRMSMHVKPGLQRDYLLWLIKRNHYLHSADSPDIQPGMNLNMNDIYVSFNLEPVEEHAAIDILTSSPPDIEGKVLKLSEAVDRYRSLVVLGDPGSGKTTLLRYLAYKNAQALLNDQNETKQKLGRVRFPILVPVAAYAASDMRSDKTLSELLEDYYQSQGFQPTGLNALFQEELNRGNCLILFDGLDEIEDVQKRRVIIAHIKELAIYLNVSAVHSNHLVITSRIADYASAPLGSPFTSFRIQGMDEQHIRQFLEQICVVQKAIQMPNVSRNVLKAKARHEIESIMHGIQIAPGIRSLAAYPLFLRILILVYQQTGEQLLRKRSEIYKQAAGRLVDSRPLRAEGELSAIPFPAEEYVTRLLSRLAYWLHSQEPGGKATEDEVNLILYEEWERINGITEGDENAVNKEAIKAFSRDLRKRVGILVQHDYGQYGFIHQIFEEYYAARYLVARRKTRARLIRQHLHDPRWDEPILLALGFVASTSAEDASDLLETAILAQGEEESSLQFNMNVNEDTREKDFLFALRCLEDQIPVSRALSRQLINQLMELLLYESSTTRSGYDLQIKEKVVPLRESRVAPMLARDLVAALNIPTAPSHVRLRAVTCLLQLEYATPEVIDALVDTLHDTDRGVRNEVVKALERLGIVSGQTLAKLSNTAYSALVPPSKLRENLRRIITTLVAATQDKQLAVQTRAQKSLRSLEQIPGDVMTLMLRDEDAEISAAVQQLVSQRNLDPFFRLWSNLEEPHFEETVYNFTCYLAAQCKMDNMEILHASADRFLVKLQVPQLLRGLPLLGTNLAILFLHQNALSGDDPEQMRRLAIDSLGYGKRIIITIIFGPSASIQKARLQLKRARGQFYAHEYIVLKRAEIQNIVDSGNPAASLRHALLRFIDIYSISPYKIIGPITGRMFFDRDREITEIQEGTHSSHTFSSYALVGGPHIGKTSLLHQLHRLFQQKEELAPYFFGCERIGPLEPTKVDVLSEIMSAWKPTVQEPKLASFRDIVSVLAQDKPEWAFIFLLDDIDEIIVGDQKANWQFLSDIRDLAREKSCHFIFSGQEQLHEAIQNPACPLHDFVREMLLGRFDRDATTTLVTTSMRDMLELELVDENAIVEQIYQYTAGHPNIIQRLCHRLIGYISQDQKRRITPDDVEKFTTAMDLQEDLLPILGGSIAFSEKMLVFLLVRQARQDFTLSDIYDVVRKEPGLQFDKHEIDRAIWHLIHLRHVLRYSEGHYSFVFQDFLSVINRVIAGESFSQSLSRVIDSLATDSQGV